MFGKPTIAEYWRLELGPRSSGRRERAGAAPAYTELFYAARRSQAAVLPLQAAIARAVSAGDLQPRTALGRRAGGAVPSFTSADC